MQLQEMIRIFDIVLKFWEYTISQWLFLVPLKRGRWHIIPQYHLYTTYILPSGGLYNPYHLLGEQETTIE